MHYVSNISRTDYKLAWQLALLYEWQFGEFSKFGSQKATKGEILSDTPRFTQETSGLGVAS